MRESGASPDEIQEMLGIDEVALYVDNENAYELFLKCFSQWRYITPADGTVKAIGLDYCGVRVVLSHARESGRRLKRKAIDSLFDEIQDFERGALIGFGDR